MDENNNDIPVVDEQSQPDAAANLQKEIAQARQQADENLKGWQRAAADFENYKKRDEQLHAELVTLGQDQVIHVLLRWLGDLGLILSHTPETPEGLPEWKKGIDGTLKNFEAQLKDLSIERVATVGQKFDPQVHEAVAQIEGGEEGVIAEEVSPGFRRGERLFKPAQVKVYKG